MAVFSACRRVAAHMFSAGLLSYLSLLKAGRSRRLNTETSMSKFGKDHVGKILQKESATGCDRLPKECKCSCTWALRVTTSTCNMKTCILSYRRMHEWEPTFIIPTLWCELHYESTVLLIKTPEKKNVRGMNENCLVGMYENLLSLRVVPVQRSMSQD